MHSLFNVSNSQTIQSIQADSITCTTLALTGAVPPLMGPVVVTIDSATISSSSVQFTYTLNPEFHDVTPSNTIPS